MAIIEQNCKSCGDTVNKHKLKTVFNKKYIDTFNKERSYFEE